jgi:hypothetical protein
MKKQAKPRIEGSSLEARGTCSLPTVFCMARSFGKQARFEDQQRHKPAWLRPGMFNLILTINLD